MNIQKVLIIDDSEPDQFLAQAAIEKFNPDIEIMQAYDGKEALELLDAVDQLPDIIFLDINMPVMNGHEFLEEYEKREEHATVVIMLTSSDQKKDKDRSRAYKCVKKYFTKPLKVIDLEDVVHLGSMEE